jgi:2-polyprenyl-3-methyl-5-hydroxy-6-metoxy-1,4-benzoquinol methylase
MAGGARRVVSQYEDSGVALSAYLHVRWRICPFDRVLPLIPRSGRLLDVGCGSGLWLTYLALERSDLQLHGIDPDRGKLALARTSKAGPFTLQEGIVEDLPAATYDCVTILDVLYLMPDEVKSRVLEACRHTLKPGGRLVVKELDTQPLWKFAPAALQEFFAVRVVRLTHGGQTHYQSVKDLTAMIQGLGFEDVEAIRVDRGYVHPHVVVHGLKSSDREGT